MLVFENVHRNIADVVKHEIRELWKQGGARMDNQQVEERLTQVVFIIRDSENGKLAGVSTAGKRKVHALNDNYFFEFRCFINEAYRIAGLDVKLSKMTFDFLESVSTTDENLPIGILSVLENQKLMKEPVWRRAVWPEIEMYFVGYTDSGNPIRVHYFKNARI